MAADITKDFFLGAVDNKRDPVRNTRWRMLIPGEIIQATGIQLTNGSNLDPISLQDELALDIKKVQMPGIKVKTETVDYMGFKTNYAVNADIGAEIKIDAQLFEDMVGYEAILAWEQSLLNTGLLVNAQGDDRTYTESGLALGLGTHKDQAATDKNIVLRNSTVRIEQYNWNNGEVIKVLNLINAMPIDVSGYDLNHSDAKLIQFSFTLKADRFTHHFPGEYRAGL